jgi:hypothetical protein
MAGLVPAIHVFCIRRKQDLDARDKRAGMTDRGSNYAPPG